MQPQAGEVDTILESEQEAGEAGVGVHASPDDHIDIPKPAHQSVGEGTEAAVFSGPSISSQWDDLPTRPGMYLTDQ